MQCLFLTGPNQQVDLSLKYQKQIKKELKAFKLYDLKELKPVDYKNGELYQFSNQVDQKIYLLIEEVAACKLGGCASFTEVNDELSSEYFDLMVFLDSDLKIIKLKILDYFSDYGYEVNSKRYLNKFKGMKVCEFNNQEDGIDAISGATISSMALEGSLAQLCFLDSI